MDKCLLCGEIGNSRRGIIIIVPILLPNIFWLCKNHEHLDLRFDDIYDENGKRKKIITYKD
jgi:hypothetical protein